MALDQELFSKFERDWNDALAQYDARTTAARMGNVQYDPASRTFAPQEVDPSVTAGIRSELFDPIQSKWGTLAALAGGGRRGTGLADHDDTRFFQTPEGVFSVNPTTLQSKKIINVTPRTSGRQETVSAVVSEDMLGRPTRLTMPSSRFKSWYRSSPDSIRNNPVNLEISRMLESEDASNPGSFLVNPATIPFGAPKSAMQPSPPPTGFIGTPGGENLFDPTAMARTSTNPPAASSLRRYKWVQGQLQPQ